MLLTVFSFLCLALKERTSKTQGLGSSHDVYFKLWFASHFCEFWLICIGIDFCFIFSIDGVVYVEGYNNSGRIRTFVNNSILIIFKSVLLFLVSLLGEFHISSVQFHFESIDVCWKSFLLLSFLFGNDFLGQKFNKLTLACKTKEWVV